MHKVLGPCSSLLNRRQISHCVPVFGLATRLGPATQPRPKLSECSVNARSPARHVTCAAFSLRRQSEWMCVCVCARARHLHEQPSPQRRQQRPSTRAPVQWLRLLPPILYLQGVSSGFLDAYEDDWSWESWARERSRARVAPQQLFEYLLNWLALEGIIRVNMLKYAEYA